MQISNSVDLTPENFQKILVEESENKLIVVQFWSERSESCQGLMNTLERLAQEHTEHVLLAKVNCDQQQEIAMQFGIRSIPTVALVKNGQPVDGFAGVQDEAVIRDILNKHLPKPEDALFALAQQQVLEGVAEEAYSNILQAYQIAPERVDIKLLYADVLIALGKLNDADDILKTVKLVDQDSHFHSLVAKLELAKEAADSPEIKDLFRKLEVEPNNDEIKVRLAIQLHGAHRDEEALAMLFQVLQKDLAFQDAKKTFLDIIAALPSGDVLATQYRRKLYTLLY
ncbi:thioredoxin family protein [Flocculibacter collagenilyticus]|uniref:thioredoxin family protein n=1 Tax=Flocculibacter collagenilyticus TaxID=2744479 RepID=UPI001F3F7BD2|nr:co-chaperone YbbN [Flocculibacter collagenilyticus]